MLEYEITRDGSKVEVLLFSDLTGSYIKGLKEKMKELIHEGCDSFVFNLKNVRRADSSGIALLVLVQNSLEKRDGALVVTNLSDDLRNLFISMRLDTRFTLQI